MLMKKFILAALAAGAIGCGEAPDSRETNKTTPSTVDTTIHPTGLNAGSPISTDTASMNVQNVNPDGREIRRQEKLEQKKERE